MSVKEKLSVFLGTGLGSGLMPTAPGTFGSIAAIPFIYFSLQWGGMIALVLFILLSIAGNYWCYPVCEEKYGADPGCFVLDEWAGLGLTSIPIVLFQFDVFIGIGLGFAFFRFFDISKVLGINALQNLPEAHGVLFDDLLAGIYSALCLTLLIFAF